MVPMKNRLSTFTVGWIAAMAILLVFATGGMAAEFSLAWAPNCNEAPTLIGYNLYYSAGAPVTTDPDNADYIYIALDDPDFDPDQPGYTVSDLEEDVEYYFTVSAVYEDGESGMSNEISSIRSSSDTPQDSSLPNNGSLSPTPAGSSGGGSSGGCFINSLMQ
jgi:hypothetical protein